MWEIRNLTPFAAERQFLRDTDGGEVWIVVVRATFDIAPTGATSVANVQSEVRRSPLYLGKPGMSSLCEEVDFSLPKPYVDLVLRGDACSLDECPVTRMNIALKVGDRMKSATVTGDRIWEQRWGRIVPSTPAPFVRMPIICERAFGGTDWGHDHTGSTRYQENPIGRGFFVRSENAIGAPLPNIELSGQEIKTWDERPVTACFGPIARDWKPRIEHAGTYNHVWEQERRPLPPLDFDKRFYQYAPHDQQFDGLRGGEPITLTGLAPYGAISFNLPRVALGARTQFGNQTVVQPINLSSVIIDTNLMKVILVSYSHLRCQGRDHEVQRTTIWTKEIVRSADL